MTHARKLLFLVFFSAAFLLAPKAYAQLKMPSNDNAEALVRTEFAHAPEMVDVARCESGIRQFTSSGAVLRGGTGGGYIGIFQIGETIHAKAAANLGFDIYSVEGNIGYAKYLHSKQGTRPWISCVPTPAAVPTAPSLVPAPPSASEPAPAQALPIAVTPATPLPALASNLQIGITGPEVLLLQKILNSIGFPVAATGPGSPGQETTMFGSLTREAVKRFQCSQTITCTGSESTTGYGRVGPLTRAALQAAIKN